MHRPTTGAPVASAHLTCAPSPSSLWLSWPLPSQDYLLRWQWTLVISSLPAPLALYVPHFAKEVRGPILVSPVLTPFSSLSLLRTDLSPSFLQNSTAGLSCGWCSENNVCMQGDVYGPLGGKCKSWRSSCVGASIPITHPCKGNALTLTSLRRLMGIGGTVPLALGRCFGLPQSFFDLCVSSDPFSFLPLPPLPGTNANLTKVDLDWNYEDRTCMPFTGCSDWKTSLKYPSLRTKVRVTLRIVNDALWLNFIAHTCPDGFTCLNPEHQLLDYGPRFGDKYFAVRPHPHPPHILILSLLLLDTNGPYFFDYGGNSSMVSAPRSISIANKSLKLWTVLPPMRCARTVFAVTQASLIPKDGS